METIKTEHVEALNVAFTEFKQNNDKLLSAKADGKAVAELTAKVEAANKHINDLQEAMNKQAQEFANNQISGGNLLADLAYTKDFTAFMRKGEIQALSKGVNQDGGFTAPVEWDRTITDRLKIISPMRQICRVQSISVGSFSKLFNDRNTASGWVGETTARPNTVNAQFGTMTYVAGEIYANPSATQQVLDDSLINLEQWLADEVQTQFASQEGIAFVSGDGVNKPTGILNYVAGGTHATTHPWGAIPQVVSGAAGAITADGLINLVYDLPGEVSQNARFVMNRNTLSAIRRLKDTTGQYLWQPSFVAGQPSTLLGFPVVEVAAMPIVAANANAVLFGDFSRGYLIIDRVGTNLLRDPFTNKPYVSFYTTKRVGGGLLEPQVLRALRIAV